MQTPRAMAQVAQAECLRWPAYNPYGCLARLCHGLGDYWWPMVADQSKPRLTQKQDKKA